MPTDPTPEATSLPRRDAGLLERDQLITTAELSAFLSIPTSTLRQWSYLGTSPKALRVGRHLRYEPTEVRRWLAEECTRTRRDWIA